MVTSTDFTVIKIYGSRHEIPRRRCCFQSYLIADLQGPAISIFFFAVQGHLQQDIKISGLKRHSHPWKQGH